MLHRTLLVLVALLNLLPGLVAVRPELSIRFYGIVLNDPALSLTLRHRAVLLAAVGVFLALAAWDDRWWAPAMLLALMSKVTFLGLHALTGPHGAALTRVALSDAVALGVLGVAALLRLAGAK